ncbi:ABC-type bacteriocin/lantibiotic exporter with double-glycine peptidase domain [Neorhizobium huautlense]|uniref:ABC-type bacteriocin/lantibiotic exporter with double-glycine peptidase domain n=1 Tax=Neorhizobium huautlense TaxID=67774 RepID=A0ABT9PNH1_9HYPH|nr:hypothetical protein [Neorhizobium huautlense]MDP9835429.1 ABC-type bacteriocin/lantibiotic exporter with double-glycine peptidase domain [Neorhizobium huautlense]
MESFDAYIPEDIYSLLVMVVIALVAIWLVMFVVRKLIGIAIIAGLVIGGFMIWQDPSLLRTAQDTALDYYDQWQNGPPANEQPRW